MERDLVRLIRAAGADQAAVAAQLLAASPELALDRLGKDEEFFLAGCHAQLYAGDSAPHAAAFSHSRDLARQLAGLGGVTPLHRAVRNRCSDAVRVLLAAGADPYLVNDHGSTAFTLAQWTTGRGGSGTPKAKAGQQKIIRMLATG